MSTSLTKKDFSHECIVCQYYCQKNVDWIRHVASQKHMYLIEHDQVSNNYSCKKCLKNYKTRNGLWYHSLKCTTTTETTVDNDANNTTVVDETLKTLIVEVLKSNTALQQQNQDLQKNVLEQTLELQKNILEVLQKMQVQTTTASTNINNNNNNNKTTTFNMQVFLNEHCKDAMNLKEFVDSINPTVADLEMVGEKGFVDGLTNIIVTSLRATETHLRPIHCSDAKRTVMYVKENDKWEKDGPQNDKLHYMVKNVEYKNIRQLTNYSALNPDCLDTDSPTNDYYLTLSITATGGTDDKVEKIIAKIANEVVVEK